LGHRHAQLQVGHVDTPAAPLGFGGSLRCLRSCTEAACGGGMLWDSSAEREVGGPEVGDSLPTCGEG
jgi:hypothetical protein